MDYTEDFDAQFAWLTTKIECGCVKLSSTNRMILRAKILTMLLEIIPDEMHIDDVKRLRIPDLMR